MKKILILNTYGTKNLGDDAIWVSIMNILNSALSQKAEITVECEDVSYLTVNNWNKCQILKKPSPYGYALKDNKYTGFFTAIINWVFFGGLARLKNSDVVFSMGGGYLLSRNAVTDWFGLTLTLLPLFCARILRKPVIFLPMSFGPFASPLQEKLCRWCMKDQTVFLREGQSVKLYRNECLFVPDVALLLTKLASNTKEDYVALTAREWLKGDGQEKYEEAISKTADFLWSKYGLKTIFVPMCVNEIEDDDRRVALRIFERINNKEAFLIKECSNYLDAQAVFSKAKFGIHTRMHAAILSIVERTPFLLMGYGHKSKGLADMVDIGEYFCEMERVGYHWIADRIETLVSDKGLKDFEFKTKKLLSKVTLESKPLYVCLEKVLK